MRLLLRLRLKPVTTVVDPTVLIPVVLAVIRAIPWELAVTVT